MTPQGPQKPLVYVTPAAYGILTAVYFLFPADSPARDLIYALPAVLAAELLYQKHLALSSRGLLIAATASIYIFFGALFSQLDAHSGREAIFIVISILFCIASFRISVRSLQIILWCFVANIAFQAFYVSPLSIRISLLFSQSSSETALGLLFPVLSVAFFVNRRAPSLVVSLAAGLLTYKRIAVAALLAAIIGQRAMGSQSSLAAWRYVAALSFLVAVVVCGLNSTHFYELSSTFFSEFLNVRVSPDALSAGRHHAAQVLTTYIEVNSTLLNALLGHGPGASTRLLMSLSDFHDKNITLLHNDWLRIYFDYGYVGLIFVLSIMYRMLISRPMYSMIVIYTAILFVTDNVATYAIYWMAVAFAVKTDAARGRP